MKELRDGRYAPTLRIEQVEKWETLVREDEISNQVIRSQNRIPREAIDPELRLSDMKARNIPASSAASPPSPCRTHTPQPGRSSAL